MRFESNHPVRVLVVSDDPLARQVIAASLDDLDEFSVVGQIAATTRLAENLEALGADAVVWDVGPDFAEPLDVPRSMGLPVVALTDDPERADDALHAGARGVLLRDGDGDRLAVAIRAVFEGLRVAQEELAGEIFAATRDGEGAGAMELTPREGEVLGLIAEGLSNRRIAHRLGISEHTAKFHVNAILTKLDARTRTEAVVRAARLGLIHL